MKKKILLVLLVLILLVACFFIGRQVGLNTEESKTKVVTREEEVSTQNIKSTLTSSGYISAKTTEKVELSTSRYFEAMCVEDDDTVEAGTNILEYTNGTYLTLDKDCVIISHSVPETDEKCTSSNYVEVSYLDTLEITLSINENEINDIAVGQSVEITLSADESKTYSGTVTKIDSVGTYATSGTTFSVVVELENDGNIKLGMSASCTITLQEAETLAVSIDAVSENSDGEEYVMKVNTDGTVEETIIETGIANDSYAQVVSGLSEGDKVQIETEVTESDTSSSSSEGSNGDFGGGRGENQGEMPSGDDMPDMGNFDPSSMGGGGSMPSFNQ